MAIKTTKILEVASETNLNGSLLWEPPSELVVQTDRHLLLAAHERSFKDAGQQHFLNSIMDKPIHSTQRVNIPPRQFHWRNQKITMAPSSRQTSQLKGTFSAILIQPTYEKLLPYKKWIHHKLTFSTMGPKSAVQGIKLRQVKAISPFPAVQLQG